GLVSSRATATIDAPPPDYRSSAGDDRERHGRGLNGARRDRAASAWIGTAKRVGVTAVVRRRPRDRVVARRERSGWDEVAVVGPPHRLAERGVERKIGRAHV